MGQVYEELDDSELVSPLECRPAIDSLDEYQESVDISNQYFLHDLIKGYQ